MDSIRKYEEFQGKIPLVIVNYEWNNSSNQFNENRFGKENLNFLNSSMLREFQIPEIHFEYFHESRITPMKTKEEEEEQQEK